MTEKILNNKKNGMSMLLLFIALYLGALALVIFSGIRLDDGRMGFLPLMILGISAAIHPVTVNAASVWDLLILIVITVMTWLFALAGKRINRAEGILMVLIYAGVVAFAILR